MNYASIINEDFNNGEGIGVSLFVQGCRFKCKGCFNSEAWDFNGGKEWTKEVKNEFLKLIDKPYITRVSILGGEPLADENVRKIYLLTQEIKTLFPDKKIWLYSGFTYEEIMNVDFDVWVKQTQADDYRKAIIQKNIDILVDGKYIDELRDLTLKFRGSSNQRLIDVQKSLEQNKIVLWSE